MPKATLARRHRAKQHTIGSKLNGKMNAALYECMKCPHSGNKGHMLEHFIRAHVTTDRAPWSCSLCGYRAISKTVLQSHDRVYMHKIAEKKNPGAPTTFIKSNNPYIVHVGQDIRLCEISVNWDQNERPPNDEDEESPIRKRKADEQSVGRKKIRSDRNLDSRRIFGIRGRSRPSRFQDYDTQERPDMPEYDILEDDKFRRYDYKQDRRGYREYEQFSSFNTGVNENRGQNRSSWERGREQSRRVDLRSDRECVLRDRERISRLERDTISRLERDTMYHNDESSDFANGQRNMGEGSMSDNDFSGNTAWNQFPSEPIQDSYGEFSYENGDGLLPQQMSHDSGETLDYGSHVSNAVISRTATYNDQSNNGDLHRVSPQLMECRDQSFRGQSFNPNDYSGNGIVTRPDASAFKEFCANVTNRDDMSSTEVSNVQTQMLERVPASSSTIERPVFEVNLLNNPETSPVKSPTCTPRQSEAPHTASVGKVRRPSKHADQSAEIGSSCSSGKEKDKSEVTSAIEQKNNQKITARRTSGPGVGSSNSIIDQELDLSEHQTEEDRAEEEECPEDESDDELADSRLLEDKMTDLINALEPLKNISKALIALDHHMRRLLPMVENLTKDMASPKVKKQ